MSTILVVDDEVGIRALYRLELKEEGYEVLTAPDSAAALEILASVPVHLVVLDIKLPGESGLRLLPKIRRCAPQVPVILSTTYRCFGGDPCTEAADAYVLKSSNLTELKSQIAKALSCRRGTTNPASDGRVSPRLKSRSVAG